MKNWREKLAGFMMGRYGVDELGKMTLAGAVIALFLAMFFGSSLLDLLALALIAVGYFRILSRNHSARYQENQKYLQVKRKIADSIRGRNRTDRSVRIFQCPACGQKVRVPRGKGKISIHCPRCNTDFIKRT